MTKEEKKQLLLLDLCARLPHRIKCHVDDLFKGELTIIPHSMLDMDGFECHTEDWEYEQFYSPVELKPYLRPMLSMTVEENEEYYNTLDKETQRNYPNSCDFSETTYYSKTIKTFDWLNAHYFDYRGLIPMGLALEAPEGMYN